MSKVSGLPLKTVHAWCSTPKNREHKGTSCASLKKEEFINFLMQDTMSYSHPSKKYAGKKFLMHTWNEIYSMYQNQPEFHKHGLISKTAMRTYKPKYILLSGSTPPNQCLCDICENCELVRKVLLGCGIKNMLPTKYSCVDATLCTVRQGKFGTSYSFPPMACISQECTDCGKITLRKRIEESNSDLCNSIKGWHGTIGNWSKVDLFHKKWRLKEH